MSRTPQAMNALGAAQKAVGRSLRLRFATTGERAFRLVLVDPDALAEEAVRTLVDLGWVPPEVP